VFEPGGCLRVRARANQGDEFAVSKRLVELLRDARSSVGKKRVWMVVNDAYVPRQPCR
jgi:hypothetical protein